jgi:hypothetical protein
MIEREWGGGCLVVVLEHPIVKKEERWGNMSGV